MSIATNSAVVTRIMNKFSTGHVSKRDKGWTNNLVTLASSGANTDTALVAVVTTFGRNEVDGTLILSTDIKVIADSAVVVAKDDRILIGSVEYRVMSVRDINPAGTLLGYIIQCRK